MDRIKVLVAIDKKCHAFSEIEKAMDDEVGVHFMWPGYFMANNILYICAELIYYRIKGYRILHFQWLQYYYRKGTLAESQHNGEKFLKGVSIAKAIGFRIVWTCHNIKPHEDEYPQLSEKMRRAFSGYCDCILVLHKSMIEKVRKSYGYDGGMEFSSLGDYGDMYPVKGISMVEARKELDVPEDAFVFIASIGVSRGYKKLPVLVEAFLKMRETVQSDVRLFLGGRLFDGSDPLGLRAFSEGNSDGWADYEDTGRHMEEYLMASDIMVLTHEMDGVSANVYLSASFGVPLLVTCESGSTAELVLENGLGKVSASDTEALARNMAKILGDRKQLKIYSENCEIFIDKNCWSVAAKKHIAVYNSVLNS
ncbi:MAG: glycosyltransferase family 4 protein [Candidatus Tantalella remota]|nr:glycosyltransferase family 4 protein [Candidatus Tantalella remota]